jgi:uncharacterized membrane protein YedE/YeeE
MGIRWSPYVVGMGIGILSWLTWLVSQEPIGTSGSFARSAGMIEKLFRGNKVGSKPYFREFKPEIDWQWMLVIGVVIGSAIAALLSGDLHPQWIPAMWAAAFGNSLGLRLCAAFAGGLLVGFGARWAEGCTSGHGISGTMLLAVSGWISAICFFLGGIFMAHLLFNLF